MSNSVAATLAAAIDAQSAAVLALVGMSPSYQQISAISSVIGTAVRAAQIASSDPYVLAACNSAMFLVANIQNHRLRAPSDGPAEAALQDFGIQLRQLAMKLVG